MPLKTLDVTIDRIPVISDYHIEDMLRVMKPVVKRRDALDKFWEIDISNVDRHQKSYIWEPKYVRTVELWYHNSRDIIIYSRWGAPVFFKPSLAEVLGCINQQVVKGWENIRYFYLHSGDLGQLNIIDDCHWCRCTLFGEEVVYDE